MKIKVYVFALLILAAAFIFSALHITPWLFENKGFSLLKYSTRTILLLASLFVLWKALMKVARNSAKESAKNAIVLTGSLLSLLVFTEIIFTFLPISSGGENNLVAKNWFNFYWKENHLGYRDLAPSESDEKHKKNILVIGDSYVAGHGLEEETQRFANIIQTEYNDCIDVFNLAVPGADTKDEFEFLASYPVKPDLVIVAYVNNDIYKVADRKELMNILKVDKKYKSIIKGVKPSKGYLSNHSFVFSFFEYLVTEKKREAIIKSIAGKYASFEQFLSSDEGRAIEMCYYKNDSLLNLQFRNIDRFINYSITQRIPLLFVVFPKMDDEIIDFTDRTANQVIVKYLNNRGVPSINLTPSLRSLKEEDRMVSMFDPHPGIQSNVAVADTIEDYLKSSGLLSKLCKPSFY